MKMKCVACVDVDSRGRAWINFWAHRNRVWQNAFILKNSMWSFPCMSGTAKERLLPTFKALSYYPNNFTVFSASGIPRFCIMWSMKHVEFPYAHESNFHLNARVKLGMCFFAVTRISMFYQVTSLMVTGGQALSRKWGLKTHRTELLCINNEGPATDINMCN